MYINKVVSFLNSWQSANVEFHSELQEVRQALDAFNIGYLMTSTGSELPRLPWESQLAKLGWDSSDKVVYVNEMRTSFATLGPSKNGVSATPSSSIDILGRWLFQRSSLAVRLGIIKLPILLLPTNEFARRLSNRFIGRVSFEIIKKQLDALCPLSHISPFLILGYSDAPQPGGLMVDELPAYSSKQNRVFERSIEFPAEYHQAGMGILSFFGTYLSERYPNTDAVVRIEQEGLKVRMIIEGKDGTRDVMEKALQEYELIISRKVAPETIVNNQQLVLELRQELRIAQLRVEGQRDILMLQESRIDQLLNIIGAGLSKAAPITIDFKPNICITNTQTNQYVSGAIDSLEDLKEFFPAFGNAQISVEELQKSLETIELEADPAKVRGSGVLDKFRVFLDKARESSSDFNTMLDATGQGIETLQQLAGKYNRIAEWCGLPQVPSIFTK